ncbi:MAG: putative sulfate exporter family transporter [Gluconacetobacter diazotrophicus]|nr:putative sulfate exporter family transporter [Gluconacetobacter diazotrophicus]
MSQGVSVLSVGRREAFLRTDDGWAIAIGLGIVLAGIALFAGGSPVLGWVAVSPPKWTHGAELVRHWQGAWPRYAVQFAAWLVLVTVALRALGYAASRVVPAFAILWVVSALLIAVGQWSDAVRYNLEPPLLALLLGLAIGNAGLLPRGLDEGFRVEFFIKLGVVLLGATLPLSLIVWAGPVALLQASIVSVVTFGVIFAVARALGVDARLAAVLGAGGAICGVSAAIAIAAAVGARRTDAGTVIAIVVIWAIAMIFALPFAAQALHLPAAVGGAWIGTSEFADAAGVAAAQAYDAMSAGHVAAVAGAGPGAGNPNGPALAAFTLVKVVGRDVWIGVWAVVLSVWFARRNDGDGVENHAGWGEVWRRFPKFVLGFLAASVLLTIVAATIGHTRFTKIATPELVTPIKTLRTWAFAFGFLAIGLTTRFGTLAGIAGRPMLAFSAGVVVNVFLGLALSAWVFGAFWSGVGG